jgi:hypothetical protein
MLLLFLNFLELSVVRVTHTSFAAVELSILNCHFHANGILLLSTIIWIFSDNGIFLNLSGMPVNQELT